MKPLEFPLLTDENIHPEVVDGLRTAGKNVRTVLEENLVGATDVVVLRRAFEQGRVVVTHDGDFGTLVERDNQPHIGIVHLRPGHISPAFVLEMISAIERTAAIVDPPFIVVAERRSDVVRVRVRARVGTS